MTSPESPGNPSFSQLPKAHVSKLYSIQVSATSQSAAPKSLCQVNCPLLPLNDLPLSALPCVCPSPLPPSALPGAGPSALPFLSPLSPLAYGCYAALLPSCSVSNAFDCYAALLPSCSVSNACVTLGLPVTSPCGPCLSAF